MNFSGHRMPALNHASFDSIPGMKRKCALKGVLGCAESFFPPSVMECLIHLDRFIYRNTSFSPREEGTDTPLTYSNSWGGWSRQTPARAPRSRFPPLPLFIRPTPSQLGVRGVTGSWSLWLRASWGGQLYLNKIFSYKESYWAAPQNDCCPSWTDFAKPEF